MKRITNILFAGSALFIIASSIHNLAFRLLLGLPFIRFLIFIIKIFRGKISISILFPPLTSHDANVDPPPRNSNRVLSQDKWGFVVVKPDSNGEKTLSKRSTTEDNYLLYINNLDLPIPTDPESNSDLSEIPMKVNHIKTKVGNYDEYLVLGFNLKVGFRRLFFGAEVV